MLFFHFSEIILLYIHKQWSLETEIPQIKLSSRSLLLSSYCAPTNWIELLIFCFLIFSIILLFASGQLKILMTWNGLYIVPKHIKYFCNGVENIVQKSVNAKFKRTFFVTAPTTIRLQTPNSTTASSRLLHASMIVALRYRVTRQRRINAKAAVDVVPRCKNKVSGAEINSWR